MKKLRITSVALIVLMVLIFNIIGISVILGNKSDSDGKTSKKQSAQDRVSLTDGNIAEEKMVSLELAGASNRISIANTPKKEETPEELYEKYKKLITKDLEALKNGDTKVINKYFGQGDLFIPSIVSDRVSATVISFINPSQEQLSAEGTSKDTVIVHVCTLDYNAMNRRLTELKHTEEDASMVIAKELAQGNYEAHYNIPIEIRDNEVVISEAFKKAVTGQWYQGIDVEITPVECVLTSENQE